MFVRHTECFIIFSVITKVYIQLFMPLGTDRYSSEEYPCTHVYACVART
jgi:hypothetical protein